MSTQKPSIFFVIDERLSRDKISILFRILNVLRQNFTVETLPDGCTEDDLLKKLESDSPSLVLVPWYRYLSWSRVDAYFGLARVSGPAFAGYFAEAVDSKQLGETPDQTRSILLDFCGLTHAEIHLLVKSIIVENKRTGLRPLVEEKATIYFDQWTHSQELGSRMEGLFSITEILQHDWIKRSNSIRIALCALWSIVFGDDSSRHESTSKNSAPKAWFQVAADSAGFHFRLVHNCPAKKPKEILRNFWPKEDEAQSAIQILRKYTDAVRVHFIGGTYDVEIVASIFRSSPSSTFPASVHTHWIEPISAGLVSEIPFQGPTSDTPWMKALPTRVIPIVPQNVKTAGDESLESALASRSRFIAQASAKINELKGILKTKDDVIQELRSGGIGTAQPLPMPDPESLLEAFQERYYEAKLQIRQLELQIVEMENKGATPQEIETIRLKIAALANREKSWIKKIAATIEIFKEFKKSSGGGG